MAANTGVPGAWSSRVMASASMMTAPLAASSADTVDFPEPIPPVNPTSNMGVDCRRQLRILRPIAAVHPDPYASTPAARLEGARALKPKAIAKRQRDIHDWPANSPGAANAWLLLVTTKPPDWRDSLVEWREMPLTFGEPHEGFFYPDPLGFWSEVRKWAVAIMRRWEPGWDSSDALSLTTLVHLGESPARLAQAMTTCRPGVVLFLDEPAWHAADWTVRSVAHHVPDPHREGKVYQGFWGHTPDGLVVGKSPQHPSAHRFYAAADMELFLASVH
jgi:hypothetical protein